MLLPTAVRSNKALALTGMIVADYHLRAVEEAESAKELWESLEQSFMAKSNARRLLLRQQLSRLELGH